MMSKSLIAVVALGVATMHASNAHADVLVDENVMVSAPSVPRSDTLVLTSPGQLTVTVTDLAWPQALQSLSFSIARHEGVLSQRVGSGSLIYDITTPGSYFTTVYATPDWIKGMGVYHLNVAFMPTVVPLPAAAWLLISGLFAGWRFWRKSSSSPERRRAATWTARSPQLRVQHARNKSQTKVARTRRVHAIQGLFAHETVTHPVV